MIDKKECIKGNTFVVNGKTVKRGYFSDNKLCGHIRGTFKSVLFSDGTIVEITSPVTNGSVSFNVDGKSYFSWWSETRFKLDYIESNTSNVVDTKEVIRYKIYYKGKPFKPKYFNDMGKIKSSLLISFGYYENQYQIISKYKERNPEVEGIDYWYEGRAEWTRSELKDVKIYKFINKDRKNPIDTEFNVQEYYDQSMKLINITAQFGAAARELYKKTLETKEYSYILVYFSDEYRDENRVKNAWNFDWNLKESQKIKDIIKQSGLKSIKKSSKQGKTAIAFKTLDDLKQIMLRLSPNEYFICDCDGDQLVEKNTRFVKLVMIQNSQDEL